MSFEDCLWSVRAQHRTDIVGDLTVHYKEMLSFFWLLSFSKKTRAEVASVLESYHTVERIEKEQDPLHPKIDVKSAQASLAIEADICVQKHPVLRVLYGLQMPSCTTIADILRQGDRGYYEQWLRARNAHIKE